MRGLVVFLIILAVVALVAFNFSLIYQHAKADSLSGNVVKESSNEPIKEISSNVFDKVSLPSNLEINAIINEDNKIDFDIVNQNDETIEIGCFFDDFQEGVPASGCSTYDKDGKFVGVGTVEVGAGKSQEFTINIHPYDNLRITKRTSQTLISISPGELDRTVKLTAVARDSARVSEINIPIRINVRR